MKKRGEGGRLLCSDQVAGYQCRARGAQRVTDGIESVVRGLGMVLVPICKLATWMS